MDYSSVSKVAQKDVRCAPSALPLPLGVHMVSGYPFGMWRMIARGDVGWRKFSHETNSSWQNITLQIFPSLSFAFPYMTHGVQHD